MLMLLQGVIVLHNKKKQKLEDGRPNYTMQFIKNVSESLKSFGFDISQDNVSQNSSRVVNLCQRL